MDILICDDNPIWVETIKKYIQADPQFSNDTLYCFNSAAQLLDKMRNFNSRSAVVILDINLDKSTEGISLAIKLNEMHPWLPIIFLTGYLHYATDIYRADFVSFVTKPVDSRKLKYALERATNKLQNGRISFHLRGSDVILLKCQICYIERLKRTSYIHTIQADGQETLEVSESLSDILVRLCSSQFVQCHKSYIVNLAQVNEFTSRDALLFTKERIPLSRAFYPRFKDAFADYLGDI